MPPDFASLEISHQGGKPVELYVFTAGAVVLGRFNNGDTTVTVGGDEYIPWPGGIVRGSFGVTTNEWRNGLRFVAARSFPIAEFARARPRTGIIGVTLHAYHRGAPSDVVPLFGGRVLNVKRANQDSREFLCEGRTISLKRVMPRELCQVNCPHVLYGRRCALDPETVKHETTIADINGRVLTVASVNGALPYGGGFTKYTDADGIVEYAFIERGTGLALRLDLPHYGAEIGDAITIYPGCDHTMQTCDEVYFNSLNFGGDLYLPDKNAFVQNVFL